MTTDVSGADLTPVSAGVPPRLVREILAGPLLGAWSNPPLLFIARLSAEIVALHVLLSALDIKDREIDEPGVLLAGMAILLLARVGFAVMICGTRRRIRQGNEEITLTARLFNAALRIACYGVVLAGPMLPAAETLVEFPDSSKLTAGTSHAIDQGVEFLTSQFEPFFDGITWMMRAILDFIEDLLVGMPWTIVVLLATAGAYFLAGVRMAVFTAASLVYIGLFGFWEEAMTTMALVVASLFFCVVFGLPLGILCAKNDRTRRVIEPVLDVMQTLPTFVYLIPAVALFSIGKPPGVIATVIFALPSMVRLTDLGIRQVPESVKEASLSFGASAMQLLIKVELPLALPSIKVGINQTIMMSLSMAVVAAMIGAGGLGLDVIRALSHLQTGKGILAGMALVLCAMMLDKFLRGRTAQPR